MNLTLKRLLLSAAAGAMFAGVIASPARAGAIPSIPLASLAGNFVVTGTDSIFDTDVVAQVLGEYNADTSGNYCGTFTISPLGFEFTVVRSLTSPTSYNPNTGAGTFNIDIFTPGGGCAGSVFLPGTSTPVDDQIFFLVASKGGSHIDSVLVSSENIPGAEGAFSSNKR